MEISSVLHGANKRYAYALDKDLFLIRITTKKNDMKRIILHYQDKYIPVSRFDTRKVIEMEKYASDSIRDYYQVKINIHLVCLRYYFELIGSDSSVMYFGNERFFKENIETIDYMFDLPQTLREEEMFIVPAWAKNKVVYQIFPSRFASSIDVSEEIWYKAPINHMTNLGGNLKGITKKLNHIHELGADVIYLTPIFRSPSMHKYDTIDYYQIDPTFGSKEDLIELVDSAHKLGIRIILDGVFNHTSREFFAFKDIMENKEKSKYLNWYYIDSFPLVMEFGKKPNFKCFSYFGGMPKLKENNKEVRKYFIDVAKYWIKEAKIDGWRLDVADEIAHSFFRDLRNEIKEEYPDTLIIGEVWHYADDFLDGDEWDTVMNYDFLFAVKGLLSENRLTVSEFYNDLSTIRGKVHYRVYPILWNLLDSHDTERFYNSVGYDKGKMMLASAFQLLSTGMPLIYYGDEYGMEGGHDPDSRRGMYWDEKYQDLEMYSWYRDLISVRKTYPSFLEEEDLFVTCNDDLGTIRIEKEHYVIIYNASDKEVFFDELKLRMDLISGVVSDGYVKGYGVFIYKK
ncbi:glycosidase [Anaeroplasma bactoclasticum]|jgi:glycosidase|uniref:Glycosidase n=1 Tax=Anaeroplasma bactoclasticum TaxID=2088 RepID=A0A397RVJ0_9MOLU|nr:glycoside hydrolase family 13 protein [Anaeroplasma bactoclasticum]RIA78360.1 glycosidase [Anaeroplasma bactoclasticum]